MHDVLPDRTPIWQFLERRVADVLATYGYREIRMPLLELTELFKRSIGEVTDIVEKEMYSFEDRNGDSLTLRPEGTAGVARAYIEMEDPDAARAILEEVMQEGNDEQRAAAKGLLGQIT